MKKKREFQRVINFSGGRTSGYMTIQEYRPGDIVLFCDTQREHPKTYKFINDFEAHEGIPIHRISYPGGFSGYLEKFEYKKIPNMRKRFCTIELKVRTAKRYLKSLGILRFENFIGFRADEPQRVKGRVERFHKIISRFPLYEQGITKPQILDYWKNKPYDLEIPAILGNCTLCFMKGENAIIAILREYPELADPWIHDEKMSALTSGHTYFKGTTIEKLRDHAQHNLFKDYSLDEISPAFNCACTT